MIDQHDAELPSVVRVDGARRIEDGEPLAQSKPRAWSYLALISGRDFQAQSSWNQAPFTRLETDRLGQRRAQIQPCRPRRLIAGQRNLDRAHALNAHTCLHDLCLILRSPRLAHPLGARAVGGPNGRSPCASRWVAPTRFVRTSLPLQNICAFERGLKPSLHAPAVPRSDRLGGSPAGRGGEASPGGLSVEQIQLDAVSETTSCDIEER